MEYYVYEYLREDGTPYYIGKGQKSRAWSHTRHERIHTPTESHRIIILEKNLLYLRIQIPELNLVKNSGVTWSNLSLVSKYKRLVNFCFEAYKELKT